MKVLVTGASGKLGRATCAALVEQGFEVRAVDARFRPNLAIKLELGDLKNELEVYRFVEGADAVVHLANHPNLRAGPSPQRVLSENTAMNINVFRAARELGIKRLLFASSIQAMFPFEEGKDPGPEVIQTLPLDGDVPANPGSNEYGLSKEFGERLLEETSRREPSMTCAALRFPGLANEHWQQDIDRWGKSVSREWLSLGEGLSHLYFEDAATLIAACLTQLGPGFHRFFPALTHDLVGMCPSAIAAEFYPHARVTRPLDELGSLIDITRITELVGWKPERRLRMRYDTAT